MIISSVKQLFYTGCCVCVCVCLCVCLCTQRPLTCLSYDIFGGLNCVLSIMTAKIEKLNHRDLYGVGAFSFTVFLALKNNILLEKKTKTVSNYYIRNWY